MDIKNLKENETIVIDVWQILSALWMKKILIAVFAVIIAVITYICAALITVPKYQSDILIYVNNNKLTIGDTSFSISTGEITAARQLLDTYLVALKSRSCLDSVIEKASLPYTRSQLDSMISASSVNETEWFTVKVTSTDPEEAKVIANTIAEVLPDLLSNTIKGSSVEIVDFAIKPEINISTSNTTYAAWGFLIGFAIACAFIVITEIFNDKIQDENTLSEIANDIPVLANIPIKSSSNYSYKSYGYDKKKKISPQIRDIKDKLPICGDLDFAAAEAYKLLQKSVQYSFDKEGCKVIGITSSERNEGKSTLAINLSYMLSCDKQKVLLIEGDMRLPTLAKRLGIESTPGLSDYLTGKAKNNEGIHYSAKAPSLSVICSGTVPPNPFNLLGSASTERLFTALKNAFDYIIVDLPPVNIVSDPLAIAKYLDGFVICVRNEYSTKQGIKDTIDKLKIVNSNIIGFVLNGNDSSSDSKYGKYGKYGKYSKYGKYGKYYYQKYSYQDKDYKKSYERAAKKKSSESASTESSNSTNTASQ